MDDRQPIKLTTNGGRNTGFTLLELLVSITLLSLIALIMLGGLRLGTRIWKRDLASADAAESVDATRAFLRRELANAYPLWQAIGPNQGKVAFEGAADSLTFIAPSPNQLSRGSSQQLRLERGKTGGLDIEWHDVADDAAYGSQSTTILPDVPDLELAYFGPDATGHNPQWWNNWTGRTKLPELIRINVRFAPGDRRVWPELVVRPEIIVDVACVYDPIYRGCRGR